MNRFLFLPLAVALLGRSPELAAKPRYPTLRAMPLSERCAIARVLANQVKDMSEWLDQKKFAVLHDGAIDLLVTDDDQLKREDQMPSIFASGEKCEFSLPFSYELGKGQIKVRLGTGKPPPQLPNNQAYALLFATEIQRGWRWRFEWPLNRSGYGGCSRPNDAGVSSCGGLSNTRMGMPTIRIVVARTKDGNGFEAEQAIIDMVRHSEP